MFLLSILASNSEVIVISDDDSNSLVLSTESEIKDSENILESLFTPEETDEAWNLVYGREAGLPPGIPFGFCGTNFTEDIAWGVPQPPPNTPDPVYYDDYPESPAEECAPPKKIPRFDF